MNKNSAFLIGGIILGMAILYGFNWWKARPATPASM